jgi:hypothetical protein
MRNTQRGGMQTAATGYSIYCPFCNKPAATRRDEGESVVYLHFTKHGNVQHVHQHGTWSTKREKY